mgnify:CR=1 FL=1
MSIGQKLDLLMNIFKTTNKELSDAILVDQSLISRWRNEKRKLDIDSPYLPSIRKYFSELLISDNQKEMISKLIEQSADVTYLLEGEISTKIKNWLESDSLPNYDYTVEAQDLITTIDGLQNLQVSSKFRTSIPNDLPVGINTYEKNFEVLLVLMG